LETVRSLVKDEWTLLFAQNLYRHEVGEALCRSMTDDILLDRAADA